MSIVEKIGVPALLEQTAEECCELAQACLKMARKLRDENPTPKSVEDIRDNLIEEMADVHLCRKLLHEADVVSFWEVIPITVDKEERWKKRLDLHMDLDDEETRDSYYPYHKEIEEDDESV